MNIGEVAKMYLNPVFFNSLPMFINEDAASTAPLIFSISFGDEHTSVYSFFNEVIEAFGKYLFKATLTSFFS